MLTEAEGCELLTRVFTARGYRIARDVALDLPGAAFVADGWDAERRVGFEYMTRESGDHLDLEGPEIAALAAMMDRGELYIFVIDEVAIADPAELEWAAGAFLDEVERRRGGRP